MSRPKRDIPWTAVRDGVHYVCWYDERTRTTHRRSLRTRDADVAAARFAEFLRHKRNFTAPAEGLTVAQALTDYIDEHAKKHVADLARQQGIVGHLTAFFGDELLSEVDVPLSQEYARARMSKVSSATVRRELNVLVAAANHAVWMKRAPAGVQVDLPPERRLGPDDEAPYLTVEQHQRMLDIAAATDRDLWAFEVLLYQTGARRRSIEDLTRGQVRMAAERIVLQQPGKRTTKKRQPIVPILAAMREPLEWLLAREPQRDRLFAKADYYREHVALAEAAGVPEGLRHPHVVRHTRATHLLQKGKTLYDVAKLLGDTVATVERVYGHHSADHLKGRLDD